MEDERVFNRLERPTRLRISPVQHDSGLSFQIEERSGLDCSRRTLLAEPGVVPDGDGVGFRLPSASLPQSEPVDLSAGRRAPAHAGRIDTPNRMETIRNCLRSRGFSDDVIEIMLAASRTNTYAAYQPAWTAWRDWCGQRDVDPLLASLGDVLKFLTESFQDGKSYSTINIIRSMLSSTLSFAPSGLHEVGKHPLVVRLLKGIYNSNLPKPRYTHTWDPAIVLSHLALPAQAKRSRIQISRKTATILALTTLLRCSELASIQLDSVSFSNSKATFVLGKLRKSQRTGPLQQLSVGRWLEDLAICPVTTLQDYINCTASIRNASNMSSLFVSTTRPFQPVNSSTIGRWIKDRLKEAGIDTNIFSAHSTRGAAASKAASSGAPIHSILKQGNWSRESTFARFYNRTVDSHVNLLETGIHDYGMEDSSD